MQRGFPRRIFLAAIPAAALSGCITNPNAVTAASAPHDAARSGKGYVAYEVYMTNDGLLGPERNANNAMFVNTTATFSPFYLRTPDSMKVQSVPVRPGAIYALDPGTYRLVFVSMPNLISLFGMGDSPVEFNVYPGEVVYLGALQYDREKIGGFFDPNHYRVSFKVNDELEANRAAIEKNLALLPGTPPLQTRLMTIRRPVVEVSPHPHFAAPEAPTPEPPPPPLPPPPPPPPPSNEPWHATPPP